MAHLTVGRIVHAIAPSLPQEVGHYGPMAALCTHLYAETALLRVFFSVPAMDKVVRVPRNPGGPRNSETWTWAWPPRDP